VWCVCVRVCVLLLRRAHQRTDGNAQIPLFADTMTNDVSVAFGALPERLAIVLNGACCPSVPFTFTFSVTHAMSCEATQFGAPVHPAAFALVSIHMHAHAMQHAHHHGHPPPPPPPHTHTHTHTHTLVTTARMCVRNRYLLATAGCVHQDSSFSLGGRDPRTTLWMSSLLH
jgi:hypothetical protein